MNYEVPDHSSSFSDELLMSAVLMMQEENKITIKEVFALVFTSELPGQIVVLITCLLLTSHQGGAVARNADEGQEVVFFLLKEQSVKLPL